MFSPLELGSLLVYILRDTLPVLLMTNEFGYVGSVGKGDYIAIMHVAWETVSLPEFQANGNIFAKPNTADARKNGRFGYN